jgi:hypothetical protein
VFKNWDLFGKSPATSFLQGRKLMVGYRRPKKLREFIVRAKVQVSKKEFWIVSVQLAKLLTAKIHRQ